MNFQEALAEMSKGKAVRRTEDWDKNFIVFKQIPQIIDNAIIPKMTSVPTDVKKLIMNTCSVISYNHQTIMMNLETGEATYFIPTIKNCEATDWEVVTIENY